MTASQFADKSVQVFKSSQSLYESIPGSPFVYWISDGIRKLFTSFNALEELAKPCQGVATSKNERFLRFWWEVGNGNVYRLANNHSDAVKEGCKWVPYLKGAGQLKWFGKLHEVINWQSDGKEIRAYEKAVIRNNNYFFRKGVTWTLVGSSGFSARINPGGALFDVGGSCAFPQDPDFSMTLLGILNSDLSYYLLSVLNPTINTQIGDIARLPIPNQADQKLDREVTGKLLAQIYLSSLDESEYKFTTPPPIHQESIERIQKLHNSIQDNSQINELVYDLYGLDQKDIDEINCQFRISSHENENSDISNDYSLNKASIAQSWISYAVGIILTRYFPGRRGSLGASVYDDDTFNVYGILDIGPEWKQILATMILAKYTIDEQASLHVFNDDQEKELLNLQIKDGITEIGDAITATRLLSASVQNALGVMLGESKAMQVINDGTKSNLNDYLSNRFFSAYHINQHKNCPVYWPIQSAKRSYGFVLFHEKIEKDTFYRLQREFLDPKRRSVQLRLEEIQAQLDGTTGRERKALEKELAETQNLSEELAQFASDLEEITSNGYEPEPNWIDDGIILRMAPLWKVIPLWQSEPKKYWERLENGDYDWSHIAMHYWPERVTEKCKKNKSFAIAHGLEHLYEGE